MGKLRSVSHLTVTGMMTFILLALTGSTLLHLFQRTAQINACDQSIQLITSLQTNGVLLRQYAETVLLCRKRGIADTEAKEQFGNTESAIQSILPEFNSQKSGSPLPEKQTHSYLNHLEAQITYCHSIANGRDPSKYQELAHLTGITLLEESLELLQELSKAKRIHLAYIIVTCFFLLGYLILLAILYWIFQWKYILRPLQNLARHLQNMQQRNTPSSSEKRFPLPGDIEKQLTELDQSYQQNALAKETFFASMSHEIRTPLNGIIGFIASLADTHLNAQQSQYLQLIDSSSKNLLHAIDEILDFSKLNANSLELEQIAFNVTALLKERLAMASQAARGKSDLQLVGGLPQEAVIIRSDPARLRQIIDNLLSNAIKFTEQGSVTLTAHIECQNERATLSLSVQDTGIGISLEEQTKLFQPYSQANQSTARKYGGTGLGLLISQKLVKLLGGELRLQSRPGQGSTFSFQFTASLATEEEAPPLSDEIQITLPPQELKKKYALLVDDTATNLFLLETICQNAGLPYRTASNGLEAVTLCQKEHFDIIFMDIQMPIMDGYTAISQIRQQKNTGTTHIVALTASAYRQDVEKALASGANAFIPKPFERNQLLQCIADGLMLTPECRRKESPFIPETQEEATVRQMHDFMRERYAISLGEIKMILTQTAADWRPVLEDLAKFVQKSQTQEIKAILHKLKGQLSSIGLEEFAQNAADIMQKIDAGEDAQEEIQALIPALTEIFKVLEKQVTIRK